MRLIIKNFNLLFLDFLLQIKQNKIMLDQSITHWYQVHDKVLTLKSAPKIA